MPNRGFIETVTEINLATATLIPVFMLFQKLWTKKETISYVLKQANGHLKNTKSEIQAAFDDGEISEETKDICMEAITESSKIIKSLKKTLRSLNEG